MQKNVMETLMGAVVLIVAAGFLAFAYRGSDIRTPDGYKVSARFTDTAGISLGSDVRIGGIKVGVVTDLALDVKTYEAIATLQIRRDTELPDDSSAAIVSSGLLGDKYVQITPGGSDAMLAEGGRIGFTQSAVNLEEMIGKFMFSGGGVDKKNAEPESAPAP